MPYRTGDVALAARPATAETFAAYGRLLSVGDRTYLAKRGRALVSLRAVGPGPRRVTHLQRYPEANRLVFSVDAVPLWIVVLPAGDRPGGPPAAFYLPPDTALQIDAGVWHAGPQPLRQGVVCEMLEAVGAADRLDRCVLSDLIGAEAVRVSLPEEPGAPPPELDLTSPHAVMLDAALTGRIRLACLRFDDLDVRHEDARLATEMEDVRAGLVAMWGPAPDPHSIPGVQATRALFEALGIDPTHLAPSSEALLFRALAGKPLDGANTLADTIALCALRMHVPIAAYDCEAIVDPVVVRVGSPGEGYMGAERKKVRLAGRPVLCDRDGPFGSPVGDSERTRITHRTRRALVVLYPTPHSNPAATGMLLDGVAGAITQHCGGVETGRLIVG